MNMYYPIIQTNDPVFCRTKQAFGVPPKISVELAAPVTHASGPS
jgi:hypothetical protein